MNERILELARQVWPDPSISHTNHLKFAELIVTKCAVIATRCESNGTKNIGAEILEHFGVKE